MKNGFFTLKKVKFGRMINITLFKVCLRDIHKFGEFVNIYHTSKNLPLLL